MYNNDMILINRTGYEFMGRKWTKDSILNVSSRQYIDITRTQNKTSVKGINRRWENQNFLAIKYIEIGKWLNLLY